MMGMVVIIVKMDVVVDDGDAGGDGDDGDDVDR